MSALYGSFSALLLATALVPMLAARAAALGLLDQPNARKIHRVAVPRVGGIAIAVGTLISVLLWFPLRPEMVGYLAGGLVIVAFGIADDRLDLDYRLKFAGQIGAALTLVILGDIQLTRVPFEYSGVWPAWLGLLLTVVAVVGVTNAVNLTDGMDGLAAGTSLLAAAAIGYFAYIGGDITIALVALSLIGATLGFLRYNTHPAQVFMGDAGSQFLGFSIAALGIVLVERSNTAISPLLPVLILGLPILDTLYVMARRIMSGRSPFSPDRLHLHYRLLDAGMSQRGAVILIYTMQALLILIAWILQFEHDLVLLAAYLAFCASVLVGVTLLGMLSQSGVARPRAAKAKGSTISSCCETAVTLARVSGRAMVLGGVSLMMPVAAYLGSGVTQDIGWLALMLLILLLGALRWRWMPTLYADRLAAFGASAMLVYMVSGQGPPLILGLSLFHTTLLLIIVGIALWLRFGTDNQFQVNALDVLIALVVAIVPHVPVVQENNLGSLIIETVVMLYACELILNRRKRGRDVFRLATVASLTVLATRGLFGLA